MPSSAIVPREAVRIAARPLRYQSLLAASLPIRSSHRILPGVRPGVFFRTPWPCVRTRATVLRWTDRPEPSVQSPVCDVAHAFWQLAGWELRVELELVPWRRGRGVFGDLTRTGRGPEHTAAVTARPVSLVASRVRGLLPEHRPRIASPLAPGATDRRARRLVAGAPVLQLRPSAWSGRMIFQ